MSSQTDAESPCRCCKKMVCRTRQTDCYDIHDSSLNAYLNDSSKLASAHAASALIDNGRAGTLSRVEEVIEYCHERGFKNVAVAYCFGIKDLALELCDMLERAELVAVPVSCTSGAVLERELDPQKHTETVSCNPAGQALVINARKPDLLVEMGLCLGHDIILHQMVEVPFTVLAVKDRTTFHNPLAHFSKYTDAGSAFINTLDDSFAMKPPGWLAEQLADAEHKPIVVDLRAEAAFKKSHIPGSIQILLKDLPQRFQELDKHRDIVCVCNGSVQSAYAIMFLYSRGRKRVHNLSGGFSRWEKEGFPVAS